MGFTHQEILKTIPEHLQQFVENQDYKSQYTAHDHAAWRYIMHQQVEHLSKVAHPVYLEGLKKTGIATEHVPSIEEMNRCLSKLGWRAVVVNGFIPAQAFMEFHAHQILPVALDMRTIEHAIYTPAPDIVHEAGGHAPFIADVDYGEYLQKFGEYGMKAMFSQKDIDLYETIRTLSIVKEDPTATQEMIDHAEEDFHAKNKANTDPSEAALLIRMFWWTAEYGLVGSVSDYKIFGAGLLSSMGESRSCLDDEKVKKIPLTVDCIQTKYDITEPQPQLFVTKSCKHMTQVLEEFANNMCFRKGGVESIQKAIDAGIVATCEYSSGLQVSGKFNRLITDSVGNEVYIGTVGPTQLSYDSRQLPGHDTNYHSEGFGSPVGGLQNIIPKLEKLSIDEMADKGIKIGAKVKLEFLSGITVEGDLKNIIRKEHKNVLMTFENCTVTDENGNKLFQPEWGNYDMAVGKKIVSVYSGSADQSQFATYPAKSASKITRRQYSKQEEELHSCYQRVRNMRESQTIKVDELQSIFQFLQTEFPKDWLLRLEILELSKSRDELKDLAKTVSSELEQIKSRSQDFDYLISSGLRVLC